MKTIFCVLLFSFGLYGCAGTDPMIIRALERNRTVWEEDKRPDLDADVVKSRIAEFEAQLRYANSK